MAWLQRAVSAVATGVTSTINPTGILTINKPTGTASDDLLIMVLVHHGSAYATLPSGWTLASQEISGTTRGEVAWLRAGGSEPANYTVLCPDSSVMAGRILGMRGALLSGNALRSVITQANSSGAYTCPSITPELGDLLVFCTMTGVQATVTSYSLANGTPILGSAFMNNAGSGSGDIYGTAYFGFCGVWQRTSDDPTGAATWFQTANGENVGMMLVFKPEPPPASAPTNLYPQTATAITSLPDSITQDTTDASSNDYDVWYSYTAQPGDHVIGLWGYGGGGAYHPRAWVFDHIPPPPYTTGQLAVTLAGSGGTDRPLQFPTTEGVTYYFQFARSALTGAATIQIEIEAFTDATTPTGAFLVNDDNGTFPAVTISSSTDNTVYAFLRPVHGPGESMAILPTGQLIIENNEDDPNTIMWYPADLSSSSVITLPFALDNGQFYSTNKLDTFYAVHNDSPECHLYTISAAGAITSTRTIPTDGVQGIAVSPDETILYYSDFSIKRFDLVNNLPLSDLVASVAGTSFERMVCLDDGTLVVVTLLVGTVSARRYSAAGVLLNTYTFAGVDDEDIRLQTAADDPNSFWIWLKQGSARVTGISQFKNVKASDGTILDTVLAREFEIGSFLGTLTGTPERFGHSESCDFVVLPLEVEPPGEGTGTIIVLKQTNPDTDTTEFAFTAGNGLAPAMFSLATGEDQTFEHLSAGTYSVVETPADGYFTTYSVSNGSTNTAITVADDETVNVIVTNIPTPPDTGDPEEFPIRYLRRAPIISDEEARIRHSRAQVVFQHGIGTTSGQGEDPQCMMRFSDDGGHTWSSEDWRSLGKKGAYDAQVLYYRLGQARNRVYEVVVSDPAVPVVLIDLVLDLEKGTN